MPGRWPGVKRPSKCAFDPKQTVRYCSWGGKLCKELLALRGSLLWAPKVRSQKLLGEVTGEYDEHDVRWIERRQRASDEALQAVMEQRFAFTAARALRKAAEGQGYAADYLSAARKVASGEWHYLDLCPILACAPSDLKMTDEHAYALERSNRRLRALYRYWE